MSRLTERLENYNRAFNILKKSVDIYNLDKKNEVMHMALIHHLKFVLNWVGK